MIYSQEVEMMCPVAQGANHGPAPIPEEAKWVQAKEIEDISGFTHGIGHPYCIGRHGYRSALADSYNTSVHFSSSLFLFWSVSFVSLRCISLSISLDILSSVMMA